jgi:hypothetical protein
MSRSFSKTNKAKVAALDLAVSLCANLRERGPAIARPSHVRRSLDRIEARIARLMVLTMGVSSVEEMSDKRRRAYARLRQDILDIVEKHFQEDEISFASYVALTVDVTDTIWICTPPAHRRHKYEWSLLAASLAALYRHMDPEWTHPEQDRVARAGDEIAHILSVKWPQAYIRWQQ